MAPEILYLRRPMIFMAFVIQEKVSASTLLFNGNN
jgi:hypothetical protein